MGAAIGGAETGVAPDRPGRHRALDGVRGVAVVAVILYHADHTLLPGGFIGVDLFFVLSGYLITTLLLGEHERAGGVSVVGFWRRRMRRLWPSAWVTLAAIAIAAPFGVWGADRERTVPAELGSAFAHIANWYQIGHGGYIGQFAAPSPVRHYWSLAIEEQYYLVWPLLLGALLVVSVQRRRVVVPAALALLAGLSVGAGFLHAGAPDRAYLGTDVRLVALVVGAALAWVLRSTPLRLPSARGVQRGAVVAGFVGLAAFAVTAATIEPDASWLPRGGFALVAMGCSAIVIGVLAAGPLSALFATRPAVWLGRISFALYLVHWPLLVALGPGRPVWVRLVVALPVSSVVAQLLHVLVERPVIERRIGGRTLAVGFAVAAAASVVALIVAVPEGRTPTEQVARSLGTVADPTTTVPSSVPSGGASSTTCPTATTSAAPGFGAGSAFDPATVGEVGDPTAAACGGQIDVLVVGDSTGRGAANGLAKQADPRLRIWDRTVLGCSFGDETCPDWRSTWQTAISTIRPQVVLVYAGVVSDLHGVDDAAFLSDRETSLRATQLADAARLLSSGGARVLFTSVAVPRRPNGLFFCKGEATNSNCDPRWVAAWNSAIATAATAAPGGRVIDVAGWLAARGTSAADRPDGLHLAGASIVDHAAWLVPQIVDAAGR